MLKIHGWEPIIPQLAAYFVVREFEADPLTPFNLFLTGEPGTNKSGGLLDIAKHLGLSIAHTDMSTLDDIAELAGIIDLNANRTQSEARMISGSLLRAKLFFGDEWLHTRGHVMGQTKLFLQGKLNLLGKEFEDMETESIVSAGNLTENMQEGQANLLDSPTADRFSMVIEVPPMWAMDREDRRGILMRQPGQRFTAAFDAAIQAMRDNFEDTFRRSQEKIVNFVDVLCVQLGKPVDGEQADAYRKRKVFSFNGRRGQILMKFVGAALALCKADATLDRKTTMWQIVRDCLVYHRLSGLSLDMAILQSKFDEVYDLAFSEKAVEALIAGEPTLSGKLTLMIDYLEEVNPITKVALLGEVVEGSDVTLQLACKDLVKSPLFAHESAELGAMVERLDMSSRATPFGPNTSQLKAISMMSRAEALAFGLCGGDAAKMQKMMVGVNEFLVRWGVRKPKTD